MTQSPAKALLLIDIQQGMDDPVCGARNNPDAERRIAQLLAAWRQARWPVIHVQHMSQEPESPLRPDAPGNAFKPEAEPQSGEPVFRKTVNSAFIGTTLEDHLRQEGIHALVIAGMTTDQCVSTTARMANNLGFDVVVVEDATATFERTGPDGAHYTAFHRAGVGGIVADGLGVVAHEHRFRILFEAMMIGGDLTVGVRPELGLRDDLHTFHGLGAGQFIGIGARGSEGSEEQGGDSRKYRGMLVTGLLLHVSPPGCDD